MNLAILDDDPQALKLLTRFIKRFQVENLVDIEFQTYTDGAAFLNEYHSQYSLLLLDIEMDGLNGMEIAKRVRAVDDVVGIIFITNMAQFALQGYEVRAIDFMVKPVGYFNFARKLEKALRLSQREAQTALTIDSPGALVRLNISDILYVEKDKNYLVYHTRQGTYTERGTIQTAKDKLQGPSFSECMSGCIVNLRHVDRIGRDTLLICGESLPLSRRLKKQFTLDYLNFVGGVV